MIYRKPTKPRKNADPAYLDWIRTLPCLACIAEIVPLDQEEPLGACLAGIIAWGQLPNKCGRTEAAHVGQRAFGRKGADREAIPLGRGHHQRAGSGGWPDSHHRMGKKFWEYHKINRDMVIAELQKLYETLKAEGRI